jgi:hypothetical protein
MKKRNYKLARVAIAIMMLAGLSTSAHAQFGGLLNKAKKTAKGLVEGKSVSQVASESMYDSQRNAALQDRIDQNRIN